MRYFSIKDEESGKFKVYPAATAGGLQFQKKYTVTVNMKGNELTFYVNNKLAFRGLDSSFSWGALGVRTDMMDAYLSKIKVEAAD